MRVKVISLWEYLAAVLFFAATALPTDLVAATPASDNAANYTIGSWTNGSNGGGGFLPWVITPVGNAGTLLTNSTAGGGGDIDSGGKSFALWSRVVTTDYVNVDRQFGGGGLEVGQSFCIDLAANYRNGQKGIDLDINSTSKWYFLIGDDQYVVDGTDLGWLYDAQSIVRLTVTQATETFIAYTLTRGTNVYSDIKAVGGAIDGFGLFSANTDGKTPENFLFFNNLSISKQQFTICAMPDSSHAVLNWTSVAAHDYTLHCSTNLLEGFSLLASNISATAPLNTYTVSMDSAERKYWKLTALSDPSLTPVHWWVGGRSYRADCHSAYLVNSWTVMYGGDYRPDLEARRFHRQVGNVNEMDTAISGLQTNYAQGARLLATNLEPWDWDVYPRFTAAQAQEFVDTIDSLEGLTVVQWNHHLTWESDALPIIEDHPRLQLVEMVYPTANLLQSEPTFEELRDYIVSSMVGPYHPDKQPAIGLTVYTSHATDTPVSWELMKRQIDAAKYVGREVFGNPNHPIGIFIADVEPTDFTVDDVNEYILGP